MTREISATPYKLCVKKCGLVTCTEKSVLRIGKVNMSLILHSCIIPASENQEG